MYVCTHGLQLYSHAGHSRDAYEALDAEHTAAVAKNQAHARASLVEGEGDSFYLVHEPGDDKFDVAEEGYGTCTDTSYAYFHTGCSMLNGAKASLAATGCTGRMFGWSTLWCGATVELNGEDYVSSAHVSGLLYPRTLIEDTEVNGRVQRKVACSDPFDCQRKCDLLSQTAHTGGMPAPATCALCAPPCPLNVGTSLADAVHALRTDIAMLVRLAYICRNPVACVCQVLMLLKPAWMDNLDSEVTKCSAGDIVKLLVDTIMVKTIESRESILNDMIIRPLNQIPFVNIPEICIPYLPFLPKAEQLKICPSSPQALEVMFGCDLTSPERHKSCFYECAPTPLALPPSRRTAVSLLPPPASARTAQAPAVHLHVRGRLLAPLQGALRGAHGHGAQGAVRRHRRRQL